VGTRIETIAEVEAIHRQLATDVAGKIGGKFAEDLLADVFRALNPYSLDYAAAAARAIEDFIETGRIESLNPIAVLIAGEIVQARNLMWGRASEIPAAVIEALPAELRARAKVCRILPLSEVPGNTSLPKVAIAHLNRATAVCLVDLIVFQKVPGTATDQDLHYWCHELHHAQQYAGWGVAEFAARYVKHEMGSGLNPIEEDADLYACHFFPRATPHYIKACPV
jgi:hypothetical protein